jgi:hypothetical protein
MSLREQNHSSFVYILGVAIVVACCVLVVVRPQLREGYPLGSSDAALVCYWAPQPPPGAIPTQPDPRAVRYRDGPSFAPFQTVPPMVQEPARKSEVAASRWPATTPPPLTRTVPVPAVGLDIERKAFTEATQPPVQLLGTLPVPPTPTIILNTSTSPPLTTPAPLPLPTLSVMTTTSAPV